MPQASLWWKAAAASISSAIARCAIATVASLRDRVSTSIDSSLHEDQVRITVIAKDGRRVEKFVEHAVGSLDHPMSDKDLEAQVRRTRQWRSAGRSPAALDGSVLGCGEACREASAVATQRARLEISHELNEFARIRIRLNPWLIQSAHELPSARSRMV